MPWTRMGDKKDVLNNVLPGIMKMPFQDTPSGSTPWHWRNHTWLNGSLKSFHCENDFTTWLVAVNNQNLEYYVILTVNWGFILDWVLYSTWPMVGGRKTMRKKGPFFNV